jgi:hypothetical protein
VRALLVVVLDVDAEQLLEMASPDDHDTVEHSTFTVRIDLSAYG